MTPKSEERLKKIISEFKDRASRLRNAAQITLIIIVGVLILGIGIFYYAGSIANKESNQYLAKGKRDALALLREDIKYLEESKDRLIQKKTDYNIQLDKFTSDGEDIFGQSANSYRGRIDEAQEEINNIENRNASNKTKESELIKEIADLENQAQSQVVEQNQIWVSLSAIATRIGSVILLLFLVKILVPLYRYNIKLAAFYNACADALQILNLQQINKGAEINFENLVKTLTPIGIDFGSSPTTPVEQTVEIAKHILETQKVK